MRSQHTKLADVFPSNGVRRCDVQTVIEVVCGTSMGEPRFVKHFIAAGAFLGCDAERDQYSRVAQQMADDGLLFQSTVGGDYCYIWWADAKRS